MKKVLRRIVRRKVFALAYRFGTQAVEEYVRFITEAPIRQWRKRLWLVRTTIGSCETTDDLRKWLLFLDE